MTATDVKDELCLVGSGAPAVRRAQTVALLRLADGLHVGATGLELAVAVDHHRTAVLLHRTLGEDYGHRPTVQHVRDRFSPGTARYMLTWTGPPAQDVAQRTGLLDRRGRPILGLPAPFVAGDAAALEALWRGAFLARGALICNGRTSALTVACPGLQVALALIGAARRLRVNARLREKDERVEVRITDAEAVTVLLGRIGAPHAAAAWRDQHQRKRDTTPNVGAAVMRRANLERAERAATHMVSAAQDALAVLGDDAPQHLLAAGRLRLDHPTLSLEELGLRHHPPLTKDAMYGRLRRLTAAAERTTAGPVVHPVQEGFLSS